MALPFTELGKDCGRNIFGVLGDRNLDVSFRHEKLEMTFRYESVMLIPRASRIFFEN